MEEDKNNKIVEETEEELKEEEIHSGNLHDKINVIGKANEDED